MKRLILIFAFVALFQPVFSQDTAFLVVYDSLNVTVARNVLKVDSVQTLMNRKFDEFAKDGLYLNFYVERKIVNKRGKLKRIRKPGLID